jgi:multisubunit Na+/H+ antiporter MnhE subunit
MTIRSDYTAALIEKDLYLLGAVFSSIEEQNISILKADITSHSGIDITTIGNLYHLTPTDIEKLKEYEKEYRDYLYTYIELSMDKYRELKNLVKEYNTENRRSVYVRLMGIIMLLAAISYLFTITFFVIPQENMQIVNTIGGMVIGCTIQSMMQYFFPKQNQSNKDK